MISTFRSYLPVYWTPFVSPLGESFVSFFYTFMPFILGNIAVLSEGFTLVLPHIL